MFALQPYFRLGRLEYDLLSDVRDLSDEDYDALMRWVKTGEQISFTAPLLGLVYKHLSQFREPAIAE